MARLLALLRTSIGRKLLVAVTGLALLGFLVAHLLGNLLVLQGREALNSYAHWLQSNPLLWAARAGLLAVFAGHIWLAIGLARENRAARPARYRNGIRAGGSSAMSRYVVLTGLLVLAFVIFHLLHFTLGEVDPRAHELVDASGRHDVYGMVLTSFGRPWLVATYVFAMLVLGAHLWHGAVSAIQTFGIGHSTWAPVLRGAARLLVVALIAGNLALPLLVYFGFTDGLESWS